MPYHNDQSRGEFNDRGGDFQQRRRFTPQAPIPVKEGETYEVTIEGIGEKGDGIAKIQGFVIIVPKTQQGQRVKVRITAVRGKVSFAEVVEEMGSAPAAAESNEEEADEADAEEMEDEE
ncbi:MAG: TRAM domain-containing protein [Candidatus Iainarchaeum archaeon]|uniref:TRAM domain-containing protein n=1 Tax=Candidatus Iainarchaeum sp. TaxID=3101447 RepID=A0A7T9I1Z0_9ARCH|nr:MAG: TRAM domain-containing protein [Candidatus Diapherotrites archaeon]